MEKDERAADFPVIVKTDLWRRSLGNRAGENVAEVERLVAAFKQFHDHVSKLVALTTSQVSGLTVHDITHLDALWRVADQIAGDGYPFNPLEAFVFGGAVLLHDAAHVVQAYPGGVDGLRQQVIWRDIVAQNYGGVEPESGTDKFKQVFFSVARYLHAEQAMHLLDIEWDGRKLLEDVELRNSFGELIGKIAASHHWSLVRVQDEFGGRKRLLSPPAGFPSEWKIDALKLACLLRTADAAHIDSECAPSFLMALMQPKGISALHWNFQNKLNQPTRDEQTHLLRISSNRTFKADERDSWWLAFDTAKMIDRELRQSRLVMKEEECQDFAAHGVLGVNSAHEFSELVKIDGWEPVDVSPRIGKTSEIIKTLGGEALYGDRPEKALLELLQNAFDAIRAAIKLGYLVESDARVDVELKKLVGDNWELSITDNGVGMSKYVLTEVLLDFGHSLWCGESVLHELPGLVSSGFQSVGKFGIGFFSVFMLGEQVSVKTRRFEKAKRDVSDQWELRFDQGLKGRPVLSERISGERLKKHGTCVSVEISHEKLQLLCKNVLGEREDPGRSFDAGKADILTLKRIFSRLCPTSEININLKLNDDVVQVIKARDWREIPSSELCDRLGIKAQELMEYKENGVTVGRFSWSFPFLEALSVTHGGLNYCKNFPYGLCGVLCTSVNSKIASRSELPIILNAESLREWAENLLSSHTKHSSSALAVIKSILPEKNLAIWEVDGKYLDDAALVNFSEDKNRLMLVLGEIGFDDIEDREEYSENEFNLFFEANSELIVAPYIFKYSMHFNSEWTFTDFIVNRLSETGVRWSVSKQNCVVGEFLGDDIYADVYLFERRSQL